MRVAVAAALALALATAGCFGPFGPAGVRPQDYLTQGEYTRWVVEVDYASSEKPAQGLLDFARGRLQPLVHKEAVEFRLSDSLPSGDMADTVWSDADLQRFAAEHRDVPTGDGTVVTHLLFLAGRSEHGEVLGVAYGHDLIVLFSQSIRRSCDLALPVQGLCSPDPYFRAVLMHEFGHVLGLVNNGVPMVRNHEADTCGDGPDARPDDGHSTNRNSVMFCQVETSLVVSLFGRNPPTEFDSDDRADLKAAGGR